MEKHTLKSNFSYQNHFNIQKSVDNKSTGFKLTISIVVDKSMFVQWLLKVSEHYFSINRAKT